MAADPPEQWNPTTARLEEDRPVDDDRVVVIYVAESVSSSDVGRSLRLERGSAVIGKAPGSDLLLADPAISGHHVRISVEPVGIEVADLGSTNGTKLQGHRIERATLDGAARLELGQTKIDVIPIGAHEGESNEVRSGYGQLVGSSTVMQRLYAQLARLERSEAPVLLLGETGTGKELIARAIHENGLRNKAPYVIVDCAAIPAELLNSELFGHVEGAFTGATRDHPGAFVEADGGTIFLDEVGELPLDMQPKLLRVLETGQVKAVGARGSRSVDVRLVTATHRDLEAEVKAGRFRADLYYRIAVLALRSPALREHPSDIPLLVAALAERAGINERDIPPAARDFFIRYPWPGNVRELRNAIMRVAAFGEYQPTAGTPDVEPPEHAFGGEGFRDARKKAIAAFEESYVRDVWERHPSLSAAAREAGIDRKHLRDLLKKYGLYKT